MIDASRDREGTSASTMPRLTCASALAGCIFDGGFEMRDGLGVPPGHIHQQRSQIVVRAKVIGLDSKDRFVVRYRARDAVRRFRGRIASFMCASTRLFLGLRKSGLARSAPS